MIKTLRSVNSASFLQWFGKLLRLKSFAAIICVIFLHFGTFQNVRAAQLKEHKAEGIVALLALSLFARTAADSANAERDRNDYNYNEDLGAQENAVASCLHRAYRNAVRRGGRSLRLDEVKKVDESNSDEFEVTIQVTEFFPSGEEQTATVRCLVKKDKVTDITS